MNEATIKRGLVKKLREKVDPLGGIVYRHEDMFSGGIPDVSVSLRGGTIWAEVKLNRPGRRSRTTPLQRDALIRLRGYLVGYTLRPEGLPGLSVDVFHFDPATGDFVEVYGCGYERAGEIHERVANFLVSGLEVR